MFVELNKQCILKSEMMDQHANM